MVRTIYSLAVPLFTPRFAGAEDKTGRMKCAAGKAAGGAVQYCATKELAVQGSNHVGKLGLSVSTVPGLPRISCLNIGFR